MGGVVGDNSFSAREGIGLFEDKNYALHGHWSDITLGFVVSSRKWILSFDHALAVTFRLKSIVV